MLHFSTSNEMKIFKQHSSFICNANVSPSSKNASYWKWLWQISNYYDTYIIREHVVRLESRVQLLVDRISLSVHPAILKFAWGPGIMVVLTELFDQVLNICVKLYPEVGRGKGEVNTKTKSWWTCYLTLVLTSFRPWLTGLLWMNQQGTHSDVSIGVGLYGPSAADDVL